MENFDIVVLSILCVVFIIVVYLLSKSKDNVFSIEGLDGGSDRWLNTEIVVVRLFFGSSLVKSLIDENPAVGAGSWQKYINNTRPSKTIGTLTYDLDKIGMGGVKFKSFNIQRLPAIIKIKKGIPTKYAVLYDDQIVNKASTTEINKFVNTETNYIGL